MKIIIIIFLFFYFFPLLIVVIKIFIVVNVDIFVIIITCTIIHVCVYCNSTVRTTGHIYYNTVCPYPFLPSKGNHNMIPSKIYRTYYVLICSATLVCHWHLNLTLWDITFHQQHTQKTNNF